jgi:hypothetical protein
MYPTETGSTLSPSALALFALFVCLATLFWLYGGESKGTRSSKTDHSDLVVTGSAIYIEEEGHIVRRSTRCEPMPCHWLLKAST